MSEIEINCKCIICSSVYGLFSLDGSLAHYIFCVVQVRQ